MDFSSKVPSDFLYYYYYYLLLLIHSFIRGRRDEKEIGLYVPEDRSKYRGSVLLDRILQGRRGARLDHRQNKAILTR